MGNWSYNPTYRSYNPIYNWKGAHLVGNKLLTTYPSFGRKAGSDGRLAGHFTKLAELQRPARTWEDLGGWVVVVMVGDL